MTNPYWQGARIRLRALEERDLTLFKSLDDEVNRNVDAVYWPQSAEQRKKWLESELQRSPQKDQTDAFRWIAENEAGEAVGTIDTFACSRRNGTFKYGIALSPPFQGKGYAKEMIVLVLRFYFLELGYHKVTPHVYSFNEASLKLHRQMGFVQEGRLRQMIYTGGAYHDEIHFGMISSIASGKMHPLTCSSDDQILVQTSILKGAFLFKYRTARPCSLRTFCCIPSGLNPSSC